MERSPFQVGPGVVLGGRYRLERLLGNGAMGAVWAASHLTLKRQFAVKLLHSHLADRGDLLARFKREAEATASLDHPNIVMVVDFHLAPGELSYLVMELLEGEPLSDCVGREGRLPWRRVVGIGRQMLSALAAAHDAGIVHRDLKPANVFLASDDVVKIVDFGVARVAEGPKLTATGTAIGTPLYMPPEQVRGQPVDARADLWAVGVTLYEALAGRPPFTGRDYAALVGGILTQEPPALAAAAPDAPAALVEVVSWMLQKDLAARASSARALLERLAGIESAPAAASAAASSVAFAATMPAKPPGVVPVPTPIPTERAQSVVGAAGTETPRAPEAPPSARPRALLLLAVGMVVLAGGVGAVLWAVSSPDDPIAADARGEQSTSEPPTVPAAAPAAPPAAVPAEPPASAVPAMAVEPSADPSTRVDRPRPSRAERTASSPMTSRMERAAETPPPPAAGTPPPATPSTPPPATQAQLVSVRADGYADLGWLMSEVNRAFAACVAREEVPAGQVMLRVALDLDGNVRHVAGEPAVAAACFRTAAASWSAGPSTGGSGMMRVVYRLSP